MERVSNHTRSQHDVFLVCLLSDGSKDYQVVSIGDAGFASLGGNRDAALLYYSEKVWVRHSDVNQTLSGQRVHSKQAAWATWIRDDFFNNAL